MDIKHNFREIGSQLGSQLTRYAQDVQRNVDDEIRKAAGELREDIIVGWPVDTYTSRGAWQGPLKIGYAHYELRNEIEYASVIELGGYRGVGPKTAAEGAQILPGGIAVNGGIFPTQRPSHPVARAYSKLAVTILDNLKKTMRRG